MEIATEYFGPAYESIQGKGSTHKASASENIRREINEARKSRSTRANFATTEAIVEITKKRGQYGPRVGIHDENGDPLVFLTPPIKAFASEERYGKRYILCTSTSPSFNAWIERLDENIQDAINEITDASATGKIHGTPVNSVDGDDDSLCIETSVFLKKYNTTTPINVLVYDLDHKLCDAPILPGHVIQMQLKTRTWNTERSIGWALQIEHIIHHTPSDETDETDETDGLHSIRTEETEEIEGTQVLTSYFF